MALYICEFLIFLLCVNLFTFLTLVVHYAKIAGSPETAVLTEYDYIIVGSGTAGSLVAHRLNTETQHSILVIEAGTRGNFLTDIPVFGPLLLDSMYDWKYETTPQENACLSMINQKCKWPRGKILGGSAILNNMIHTRGNLSQYVEWFHGKHDLEYIEKTFTHLEKEILHVDIVKHTSALAENILQAAFELGYDERDLNRDFGTGFMKSPVNQKNGGRWSTFHSLNERTVLTDAQVEKVLINKNKTAYGVLYKHNGKLKKVKARKGVILCAGTVNTPQILMLSGIGPKEHLRDMKIHVVEDLPVGSNLQDHITTGLDLILFNQSLKIGPWDVINPLNLFKYFLNGDGPYTSPGCEIIAMMSTDKSKTVDLQFMVLPVGITSDRGANLKNTIGIKDEVWNRYYKNLFNQQTATILPIVLHPISTGEIRLKSSNFDDGLLINPKYLSNLKDVEVLVKGLNLVKELLETEPMRKIGAHLNPQHHPFCENYEIFSYKYWECYLRQVTLTSFHPIGTCKIGLHSSNESVVDTEFNVIGVKNLYIVDGSVLPSMPSGNVNAAIALMASIFYDTHFTSLQNNRSIFCYRSDFIYDAFFKTCLGVNF